MILPLLITLRIGRLWLPLPVALLWPLLFVLAVVAMLVLPLVRVRGTTAWQRVQWPIMTWRLLASTRGLVVDVREASGKPFCVCCY
jgi:hypothetical protein